MRVSAWFLAAFFLACGRTKSDPFTEASGGEAPSGTDGGTSTGGTSMSPGGDPSAGRAGSGSIQGGAGGASGGGAAAIQAGASPLSGGTAGMAAGTAAASAGTAGASTGMAGTALGGNAGHTTGGSAGEPVGGEAGVAGASACGAPYRACGCGCCSGSEPAKRCYYPEVAGHLESIVTEDQRIAQSADCPLSGCSTAVEYVCCPSTAAIAGPAEYEATVIPGGIDRLVIERTGDDGRCSKLSIANRAASPAGVFEIETSNWDAELGQDGGCTGTGARTAVGGFGHVRWGGQPCVVEFDFTLFFSSESGAFEGIRFSAEDIPVLGGGGCP